MTIDAHAANPRESLSRSEAACDEDISTQLSEQLIAPWLGLRPELTLSRGDIDATGHAGWLLEDPLAGSFFRLEYAEGLLLTELVRQPSLLEAYKSLLRRSSLRPSPTELSYLLARLQREGLCHLATESIHSLQEEKEAAQQKRWSSSLVQAYVFYRVPLIHPDALLRALLPWTQHLWARPARWLYALCGLFGLALVLPQWEHYFSTADYLRTPGGIALFLTALIVLKIGHELSHGLVSKHYGLHVRTMGVAFIVLWPVLYTDTTEAWRLRDRRQRLAISMAGVVFELCVASLALLAWALSPDGALRSLWFFLSCVSVLLSLSVNLNPFMRFDGYYALMDLWGVENLHTRALALMKHHLRRCLWDWQGAAPEYHPQSRRLIVFGYFTLLYRIVVYSAIAMAVYFLFFKALGLVLFLLEIWVFFVRPAYREVKELRQMRQFIGRPFYRYRTAGLFLSLLALGLFPFPSSQEYPALLMFEDATTLRSTADVSVLRSALPSIGQRVSRDEIVATLKSPQLTFNIERAANKLQQVRQQLATTATAGTRGGFRNWLLREEKRLYTKLMNLLDEDKQLQLKAPFEAVVRAVNEELAPGASLARDTYLMSLSHSGGREVRAYIAETELQRFDARVSEGEELNAHIRFSNLETRQQAVHFKYRTQFPISRLPSEALLDIRQGPIASEVDPQTAKASPLTAHYSAYFTIAGRPDNTQHLHPVTLVIAGQSSPWLVRSFRSLLSIIAAEGYL